MAKKSNTSISAPMRTQHVASISNLPAGKGSTRANTRLIGIYGPPKTGKTTSVAYLPMGRTKWLVSDSNCGPLLEALDRLPAAEDFYEITSLQEAVDFLKAALEEARNNGKDGLGIDYLVVDSLTQFFEWAQRDVAAETGQRFLGERKGWDSNGYQQFNALFLEFLDLLTSVSKYITVACIAHSKELYEKQKKGEFGGLNLGGSMAIAFGRKCNWLLLKTLEVLADDGVVTEDDMTTKSVDDKGLTIFTRSSLLTRSTFDGYTATANLKEQNRVRGAWPGDLRVLLKAEGLYTGDE